MLLLDIIRRVVPIRYRQDIGLWTAQQASKSKFLLYPYLFFLCGAIPDNLELLANNECIIRYKGHDILSPKDGIFTSWEVLQDSVYEKYGGLQEGDKVVDIGAYVGMFAVKASLQVGRSGQVIAIEPSRMNTKYLQHNTSSLSNVVVVPHIAVGSHSGEGKLTISNVSPCHTLIHKPGDITEPVTIETLDNILASLGVADVDFIKIDAEGYELEILAGAENTLKSNKVRLAVAAYHNLPAGDYEQPYICNLLLSAGFRIKVVKGYIYAEKITG